MPMFRGYVLGEPLTCFASPVVFHRQQRIRDEILLALEREQGVREGDSSTTELRLEVLTTCLQLTSSVARDISGCNLEGNCA